MLQSTTYLHGYHVLTIDLQQMMVNQYAISGSRGILNNSCDLVALEHKSKGTDTVFL